MSLSPNIDFLNFSSPFSLLPLWLPCSGSSLVALSSSHPWQLCHTGAGHRDALAREGCHLGYPREKEEGRPGASLPAAWGEPCCSLNQTTWAEVPALALK